MDQTIYSQDVIQKYIDEYLLFKDVKLKKYFDRNEQRDLGKFRDRVSRFHKDKNFEKMVYVVITDSIRDIILDTVGDLTKILDPSGDLIVSGGEAFNLYMDLKNRIITSDIDAKFVPRVPSNKTYFGKLQAIKLILWDELGKTAKRLDKIIKNRIARIQKEHPKLFKYMGIGFKNTGPYVTRRYSLIKKKKTRVDEKPNKSDVFIDVELFALDLNLRYYSPESGKIEDMTLGGILDIPFMRPKQFGFEVALDKRKGMTYRNPINGKLTTNKNINIASKEFLINDIYLMSKLKLRPDKKEKDLKRLIKLARLLGVKATTADTIDTIYKRVQPKLSPIPKSYKENRKVSISAARSVNPFKYQKYTSKPSKDRLSKQIVHGLRTTTNTNVNGFTNSSGNKRFDINKLVWVNDNRNKYVKNEVNLRPNTAREFNLNNLNMSKVLYGYNPERNKNVPKAIIKGAAAIPFVGLKK